MMREIDPDDEDNYRDILAEELSQCPIISPLIIIEHDVEVRIGAIDELLQCHEEYCGYVTRFRFPADAYGDVTPFGCCKISGVAKNVALEILCDDNFSGRWYDLDSRLGREMRRRGYPWHRHEMTLIHHHDYHTE